MSSTSTTGTTAGSPSTNLRNMHGSAFDYSHPCELRSLDSFWLKHREACTRPYICPPCQPFPGNLGISSARVVRSWISSSTTACMNACSTSKCLTSWSSVAVVAINIVGLTPDTMGALQPCHLDVHIPFNCTKHRPASVSSDRDEVLWQLLPASQPPLVSPRGHPNWRFSAWRVRY